MFSFSQCNCSGLQKLLLQCPQTPSHRKTHVWQELQTHTNTAPRIELLFPEGSECSDVYCIKSCLGKLITASLCGLVFKSHMQAITVTGPFVCVTQTHSSRCTLPVDCKAHDVLPPTPLVTYCKYRRNQYFGTKSEENFHVRWHRRRAGVVRLCMCVCMCFQHRKWQSASWQAAISHNTVLTSYTVGSQANQRFNATLFRGSHKRTRCACAWSEGT